MKFALERYCQALIDEMTPLWKKHYDEIALYKDIPLAPNLTMYARAAEMGYLTIFTARQADKLVGYEVLFVSPHPHYQSAIMATQDILFLDKSMRGGLNGYKFIKWCDIQLRAMGVHLVMQHVKKNHDFSPLLMRMGYIEHDKIYSRRF